MQFQHKNIYWLVRVRVKVGVRVRIRARYRARARIPFVDHERYDTGFPQMTSMQY